MRLSVNFFQSSFWHFKAIFRYPRASLGFLLAFERACRLIVIPEKGVQDFRFLRINCKNYKFFVDVQRYEIESKNFRFNTILQHWSRGEKFWPLKHMLGFLDVCPAPNTWWIWGQHTIRLPSNREFFKASPPPPISLFWCPLGQGQYCSNNILGIATPCFSNLAPLVIP